jgi:hypothetical protein
MAIDSDDFIAIQAFEGGFRIDDGKRGGNGSPVVFFIDREKNDAALRSMGITPNARETIIRSIETDDYVETITDIVSWGDMWVFGKDAFDKEIYIKITLGQPNSKTICISFHESEYKIDYAFKNKKGGE